MPTLDTSLLVDLIRHAPEAMRALEEQGLPASPAVCNRLNPPGFTLTRGADAAAAGSTPSVARTGSNNNTHRP